MTYNVFPIGSQVCVAHNSPFRGRKGTILAIQMIATPGKPTLCFYKVDLDGAPLGEPLWFDYDEIEPITSSLVSHQEQ
jgi:hypothetical protein